MIRYKSDRLDLQAHMGQPAATLQHLSAPDLAQGSSFSQVARHLKRSSTGILHLGRTNYMSTARTTSTSTGLCLFRRACRERVSRRTDLATGRGHLKSNSRLKVPSMMRFAACQEGSGKMDTNLPPNDLTRKQSPSAGPRPMQGFPSPHPLLQNRPALTTQQPLGNQEVGCNCRPAWPCELHTAFTPVTWCMDDHR